MITDATDGTALSLLYHLNSAPWGRGGLEIDPSRVAPRRPWPDAPPIALPEADGDAKQVAKLAARRRSCRRFVARTMPLATVASLLHACYGVTELRHETPSWARWGRTVPSAGGLYPLDLYVAARDVEALPDRVFRYDALEQSLTPLPDGRRDDVERTIFNPEFIAEANLLVVLCATFAATQDKYGPRGYRYMLLEAGHAAQNLCLSATELGCATLCLGGFDDDALNSAIGCRVLAEAALYCVAVGFAET
jgi:SagB-type dehydrogenase family enzyme